MLDGAVHHMTQAIAGKVGEAVTETVGRAAGQLQARVSAVYDTAIQDAEARLEALRAEEAVLEKRIGARTQSALVIDEKKEKEGEGEREREEKEEKERRKNKRISAFFSLPPEQSYIHFSSTLSTHRAKIFPVSRAVARSTGRGLLRSSQARRFSNPVSRPSPRTKHVAVGADPGVPRCAQGR